jgi:hypothetical protein
VRDAGSEALGSVTIPVRAILISEPVADVTPAKPSDVK